MRVARMAVGPYGRKARPAGLIALDGCTASLQDIRDLLRRHFDCGRSIEPTACSIDIIVGYKRRQRHARMCRGDDGSVRARRSMAIPSRFATPLPEIMASSSDRSWIGHDSSPTIVEGRHRLAAPFSWPVLPPAARASPAHTLSSMIRTPWDELPFANHTFKQL